MAAPNARQRTESPASPHCTAEPDNTGDAISEGKSEPIQVGEGATRTRSAESPSAPTLRPPGPSSRPEPRVPATVGRPSKAPAPDLRPLLRIFAVLVDIADSGRDGNEGAG